MATGDQWRELCGLLADAADVQTSPHFSTLYEYVMADSARMLRSFRFDRALVEDLAQDALLKILRRPDDLLVASHPRGFFRTVVVRLAQDHKRRASTRHEVLAPTDDGSRTTEGAPRAARPLDSAPSRPDEVLESQQEGARIFAALERLSARDRKALTIISEPDTTTDDVAAALGVKRDTAYQVVCRARKRLSKLLEEDS